MDDPFNWDVDRVVRELCYPHHPWIPAPELPPSDQLEACLREQGADGHTVLTYPDEPKLCDRLGIKTLKQENTFLHARRELRRRSKLYQHYLNNPLAPENAPIPSPPVATLPALGEPAGREKRRPIPSETATYARFQALQKNKGHLGTGEEQPPAHSTVTPDEPMVMGDNADTQRRPVTGRDSTTLHIHTMKRKHEEDHDRSRAKRPEPQNHDIEVIELSDDEDDNNQTPAQERETTESCAESPSGREMDTEFGGRCANRQITEGDWRRVCRMFQCPISTTSLKPPGFGIEIAAYQLHAIWWMLTQQPVRGIQGGCLGDAIGLGKTVEVLSAFAIFAMIKANYEEVVSFWKHGVITGGR